MSTHAELVARARADLAASRELLEFIENGDAIVGETLMSFRLRGELQLRISTLERLLAKEVASAT